MTLDCRASTRLLSEEMDRKLTRSEHKLLRAHLAICPACTRCGQQFREMAQTWRRVLDQARFTQ